MSRDFTFNKKITINDIKQITSLKVIEENDKTWIVDNFNNYVCINDKTWFVDNFNSDHDDNDLEISVYGQNNPTKIIDELINHFQVKFLTDEEIEHLLRGEDYTIDFLCNRVMSEYGYSNDDEKIIVPIRKQEDYQKSE
jgi:hypothetical protein